MSIHPEIDYTHVLSELSVNRKDPCEVIRELISNSYDASASQIEIYILLQYEGFIFFDNGTGLDETEKINGITPYQAFFSIGKSTKIKGECIGYKCQGSKLCFATSKFTLITRCEQEEHWRSISIDNPKNNLSPNYDIASKSDKTPWETLHQSFRGSNNKTIAILKELGEDFFKEKFSTGTMIIVQGLEVDNFQKYYSSNQGNKNQDWSYLANYICFNTRHGDMRILNADKTGFSESTAKNFQNTPGYNHSLELYIWSKSKLKKIDAGYPYLEEPNEFDKLQIYSPSKIAALRYGNFYSRQAGTFRFDDSTYCITLAIDGKNRCLKKYEELDRQGGRRSGIRLTDQRGTFICSGGVKICPFNEIFEQGKLESYEVLASSDAQSHYILMIHGNFDLVTNRNSISEAALKILKNDDFLLKIREMLDKFSRQDNVFRELIDRLKKENQNYKIDAYIRQSDEVKDNIRYRTRFTVNDICQLREKWIVVPETGEEHWVGALYTLFSHLVSPESPYANLWMRPRTFSGTGIDSLAVNLIDNELSPNVHKCLEYKYTFLCKDEFNHPLIATNQIVCWDMSQDKEQEGKKVEDSYSYFGEIHFTDELNGIGYTIKNIQGLDLGEYHGDDVKVISLKQLINKTFNCTWVEPPQSETKKKSGKRKH